MPPALLFWPWIDPSKSESRKPKSERKSKSEYRKLKNTRSYFFIFDFSLLGFFRISDFGFITRLVR
jgi:hypothetical protein